MAALKYAIIFALLVGAAVAQITRPGACPKQSVVNPFDVSRYLGKWYQIDAYYQLFNANTVCVSANYSDLGNGTVRVYNVAYNNKTLEQTSIEGTARLVNGTEGKLGVSFPVTPVEAPYWILDTDYDNYAVVWSCNNFGLFHLETAWFLSRERQPNSVVQEQVHGIFNERNISTDDLIPTRQYNCPEEES